MTDAPDSPEVILSRPLAAASMPLLAADVVAGMPEALRAALDLSPASLGTVERVIAIFSANGGTLDELAETLVCLGAYVGEVIVLHAAGVWVDTSEHPEPAVAAAGPLPMLVAVGTALWNPIGTCFARLGDPTSSVTGLWEAVLRRA